MTAAALSKGRPWRRSCKGNRPAREFHGKEVPRYRRLELSTKTAAAEHFRAMLYRHAIGARVPDPDATELGWLLERHPEFRDKLGAGVDSFSVRNALYGTRCFEIVRTDGSKTDFSFQSCVDGKRPTSLSEALTALRAEVADDILQKKREWFQAHCDAEGTVACAITGERITLDQAHADHAPPRSFGTLAIAFLEARGIDPGASLVTPPADNQYQPRLVDRALADAWKAYHHKLAAIRGVAKGANLGRAHEGKVKRKNQQLRLADD
jgi:Protein of unknown function (DUF3223)